TRRSSDLRWIANIDEHDLLLHIARVAIVEDIAFANFSNESRETIERLGIKTMSNNRARDGHAALAFPFVARLFWIAFRFRLEFIPGCLEALGGAFATRGVEEKDRAGGFAGSITPPVCF